jgi:hypothetical protein
MKEISLWVDQVCNRFEDSWLAAASGSPRPRIEDFLAGTPSAERSVLVGELVAVDLFYRRRHGEQPRPEEYQQRFPEHAALMPGVFENTASPGPPGRPNQPPEAGAELGSFAVALAIPEPLEPPVPHPAAIGNYPVAEWPVRGILPHTLGEYELLEALGAGGMGEVYRARHRLLGKLVAVKVLPVGSKDAAHAVARFQREMQAVGQLDHPNLVEAHDAGESDGMFYLVLKLIEGTNLRDLVRKRGPLPAAEACALIQQAALGLQHLHERGLVHRDVKPANLMRTPDGLVKVLDLGLARWQEVAPAGSELTETGQIMGTPDYMAPEQASDPSGADIRADLYSLGATFFYLLSGRAPFGHCKSRLDKLRAHAETPLNWHDVSPEVPEPVRAVVAKLLAKRPQERYATPQELADDLARVLRGQPPVAPVVPPAQRVLRAYLRRSWLLAAGLGLAVFAVLLLGRALKDPSPPQLPESGASTVSNGAVEPLRVRALDVLHFEAVNDKVSKPRRSFGTESFAAWLDDDIKVTARLSRPAYTYLLVFRPDGKDEVLYPQGPDLTPERTDEPRYPSRDRSKEYGLTDGTGLWLVALVASDGPLPAYAVWRGQHAGCPWAKADGMTGVVWLDDGQWLEAVTPRGVRFRGGRGEREALAIAPMVRVVDWLKAETGGSVSAVGFTVEAKK